MAKYGRPESMSDEDWLVAIEEIKQLKARRDRYVDAHDWEAYEALHAADHKSMHAGNSFGDISVAWNSAAEMVKNVSKQMTEVDTMTVHHSYDPEFLFHTPTKVRVIWAMTGAQVFRERDGMPGWQIVRGYYYETVEKRDVEWVFTTRRWHRYFATGSRGVQFPMSPVLGIGAFDSMPV